MDPKKDDAPAEAASQELYNEIDNDFREWLMKIDADQDAEERNIIALELESDVRSISLRIGRNIIEQAGEGSFIGRNVEIKKNVKKHYSAPEAYRWFKNNIWRLYPKMEGDEISEKGK